MISAIGNFVTDASRFAFKLVFIIAVRTVEISDSFIVGEVIKRSISAVGTIHIFAYPAFGQDTDYLRLAVIALR